MVMSDHRLPEALDDYLDSEMSASDFAPESLPTAEVLSDIVSSAEYQSQKPDQWEKTGLKEAVAARVDRGMTEEEAFVISAHESGVSHEASDTSPSSLSDLE